MKPLIINVALTGCLFGKEDNIYLPVTVEEIALDAARCYDAGASIFHVHAREPETHKPTWRWQVYSELLQRLCYHLPEEAIICVSTSGRHWEEYAKRSAVLDLDGIDMASLTLGTVHFSTGDSVTTEDMIGRLSTNMYAHGILPELEVFSSDMAYNVCAFYSCKWIRDPLYVNLFFGIERGLGADKHTFVRTIELLPSRCTWAATGLGKHQFKVNCWAVAMGGHVRVGLEDSLYMSKSVKATNLAQVKRIAVVGRSMGRNPATPAQAREMIWQQ